MTWAKLDDRMHDDPRTERAGLEAMGLWAIALSYMGDYATNGVISKERIRKFAGRSGHWLAERLVKAGWWVRSDGGYTLVDWELYLIPNVGTNLGRRSAEPRAKVGRTSGESTHEPPPVRGDVHETDVPREGRGETPRAGARPDPDPTRPDPERSEDQTPLPPKGAQVSILGIADGSGAGEAPAKKSKKPKLPDAPKAIDLYAAAYQAGHLDAGARITLPTASGAATIGRAAGTHAVYRCGLKITGEFLIAWIRQRAADFRRHVVNPEHRTGGFSPFGFLAWLDNGHDGKPAPWAPGTEPPPVVPAAPVYRSPPVVLTPEQQARGMAMLQDAIGGR